jgi:hypothetical protein
LNFGHLLTADEADISEGTSARGEGKGGDCGGLEDGFSDVDIDDTEFDENDLKELDHIESPARLPNGNRKCNHRCKDRNK